MSISLQSPRELSLGNCQTVCLLLDAFQALLPLDPEEELRFGEGAQDKEKREARFPTSASTQTAK